MKAEGLGQSAVDIASGFAGVLTAKIERLGGRVQWEITALVGDDLAVRSEWFDEGRVELVSERARMGIA